MPKPLSPRQLSALRWIAAHGTLPPCEPSTWKSLSRRGLISTPFGGGVSATPAGMEYLDA